MGGWACPPIQHFSTRFICNSHVSLAKQELDAFETTIEYWKKYARAFQKVQKHKSYAQVLLKNLKGDGENNKLRGF